MGTFHADAHALHGITCVVETRGPRLYVGRVHDVTDEGVVLHDADVFEDPPPGAGPTREAYLARAVAVGVWPRHRTLVVPTAEVTSVRRLAEYAA